MSIRIKHAILAAVMFAVTIPALSDTSINAAPGFEPNYAQLLQYSLYFYDANMCGCDTGERALLEWRGDCHVQDAAIDTGRFGVRDLSGGFHDAGDHVKFNLPMAYSAHTVGLAYYEFEEAFVANDLQYHAQRILDHFAEYFRKCVIWNSAGTQADAYVYQVGDGGGENDHGYWGPPEDQLPGMKGGTRRAYWTDGTSSNPGTDVMGAAAAALASNYVNFGNPEDLRHAIAIFDLAWLGDKGLAHTGHSPFYTSSQWADKMTLAAEWLYLATGENRFRDVSQTLTPSNAYGHHTTWPMTWNDSYQQAIIIRKDDWDVVQRVYLEAANKSMAAGEQYLAAASWGSTRYNTAFQMLGLIHDYHNGGKTYVNWADSQMKFILGDNPHNKSFVGGINYPWATQAHHRASHGHPLEAGGGYAWKAHDDNLPPKHVLVGGLIGGPGQDGTYSDIIKDYTYTEVATDYNAAFVGAAAGLWMFNKSHKPIPESEIPGVVSMNPCTVCGALSCACCTVCGGIRGETCICCICGRLPENCICCKTCNEHPCICPPPLFRRRQETKECDFCGVMKHYMISERLTWNATTRTETIVDTRESAKWRATSHWTIVGECLCKGCGQTAADCICLGNLTATLTTATPVGYAVDATITLTNPTKDTVTAWDIEFSGTNVTGFAEILELPSDIAIWHIEGTGMTVKNNRDFAHIPAGVSITFTVRFTRAWEADVSDMAIVSASGT
ncbi:MAG: glycoside hydrolase family 9 protein [Oscillospiraceae bacterium]|nr:glycoside hydrolase family 9 protein [Oscillospiraceae bacterium]